MAPSNDGIDIGWEYWFDSSVSRLLADVHSHITSRILCQELVLGDGRRTAHQVDVGGVHVACTSVAAGVEKDAFPAKQALHVEGLVDFELVDALFGDPAESLIDQFWVQSTLRAVLLLELECAGDCLFVGYGQQLQVVERKVSSVLKGFFGKKAFELTHNLGGSGFGRDHFLRVVDGHDVLDHCGLVDVSIDQAIPLVWTAQHDLIL